MTLRESLLAEIEAFLAETGMAPTAFGEEAVEDRALVITLRRGRDPRASTVDKIRSFMAAYRKRATRKAPRPKRNPERVAARAA